MKNAKRTSTKTPARLAQARGITISEAGDFIIQDDLDAVLTAPNGRLSDMVSVGLSGKGNAP